MLIEMTLAQRMAEWPELSVTNHSLAIRPRPRWALGKLLLAGFLLIYILGWVEDFQRIRRLEAEPTPPSKIITKLQAWQRIYRPSK